MIVGRSTSIAFESGMLLSKEMLVQLEHLAHLNEMQYVAYPDGIIYGLELRVENDRPFFTPGLVKICGDEARAHQSGTYPSNLPPQHKK